MNQFELIKSSLNTLTLNELRALENFITHKKVILEISEALKGTNFFNLSKA